jgi:hypothetical protein
MPRATNLMFATAVGIGIWTHQPFKLVIGNQFTYSPRLSHSQLGSLPCPLERLPYFFWRQGGVDVADTPVR